MKTNKLKMVGLLMSIAATFSVTSCSPEDINDLNNDNNSPLTEESIVGKKLYTNKYIGGFYWYQTEIRFGYENTAYLTLISTYNESGAEEERGYPKIATYYLNYPNVDFVTEDGNLCTATFTNNDLLVFNGRNMNDSDEEYDRYPEGGWGSKINGWHFRTNPQTITGPYAGQRFDYILNIYDTNDFGVIWFGALTASVSYEFYRSSRYEEKGILTVNYPNFTIGESSEGHFVDANTIIMTKIDGTPFDKRYVRAI